MLGWILTAHLIGVLLWVAGVLGAGRALIDQVRLGSTPSPLITTARRLLLGSAHPGMGLAILTGAWAFSLNGGYYLSQGWMLAKLAAAVAASVATIVLSVLSKKLSQDPGSVRERLIALWLNLFLGAAAAALLLVFVKPI